MNTFKSFGLVGLAAAGMLLAGQAWATTCPVATDGVQTLPGPTCIAPVGLDGAGTGLVNILAGPTGPNSANHNGHSIISAGPGANPYTQQINSSNWSMGGSGGGVNTIMLQIAGYANNYTFGIYDASHTTTTLDLFTPGSTDGTQTFLSYNALTHVFTTFGAVNGSQAFSGNLFGYFLTTPQGNTFYSNATLNADGIAHQVAYEGDGTSQINAAGGAIQGTWLTSEFIMAWEDQLLGQSDLDYNDFIVMVESVHPVPEPAVLGMFGLGLLLIGAGVAFRRRQHEV